MSIKPQFHLHSGPLEAASKLLKIISTRLQCVTMNTDQIQQLRGLIVQISIFFLNFQILQ